MHRPLVNVTWLAHPPADYSELSRTQTSQLVTKVLHSDFPRTVLREFTTATDPPATGLTHVITLVVTYNQMVVDEFTSDEVDRVFHALADATRRDIVGRVSQREQSISSLANHYSMSFAAVQKHVAVLERATLVTKERRGRQQIVHPNIEALNKAARLLDAYAFIWQERASRIADILADD